MGNQVFEPNSLYHGAIGDAPDLMVYFGNLDWRSAGTVGHGELYLSENDTGPDDSVHSMDGVMMVYDPRRNLGAKEIQGADVQQIAPILLEALGLDAAKEGIEGHAPDGLMDYLKR